MSIDLYKETTQGGGFDFELPLKYNSVLKIQNQTENFCEIWCTTAHSHPKKIFKGKVVNNILKQKNNWSNFWKWINGKRHLQTAEFIIFDWKYLKVRGGTNLSTWFFSFAI